MQIPNIDAFKSEYLESRTIQRALIAGGVKKSTATKGRAVLPDDLRRWLDNQGTPAAILAPKGESDIVKQVPPEFIPYQNRPDGLTNSNPGGGSREYSFKAGLRKKLETDGVEPVVDNVYKIASGNTPFASDQLRAAEMIRDTMDGKPTQDVTVKGVLVMIPAEAVLNEAFGQEPPE